MSALGAIGPATRRAYVGISGSGKSYAAKAAIAEHLKANRNARVIVFDPLDEWSRDGKKSKHVNLGPCQSRATFEQLVGDPARYLDHERVSLAVVPSDDWTEQAEQVADFVSLMKDTGDFLVVFEETGLYAGPDNREPVGREAIAKIAFTGRHWGCPLVFCAQRLVQVPKMARAQVNELQIFQQTDEDDLKALEKMCRARLGSDVATRVASLNPRESIVWSATAMNAGKEKRT